MEIKKGDILRCIFTSILPDLEIGPELKMGEIYECKDVYYDKMGTPHIDVGLVRTCEWVTSYASKEILPGKTHWCHPNRFIILKRPE